MRLSTVRPLIFSILSCSLFFCLFSCKKDKGTPTSPPAATTGTMNLSTPIDSSEEIIVSETGGKILLDSLFMVNTIFSTTLHTNDPLVDITTISYSANFGDYFVNSYKGVNPSAWTTVSPGYYSIPISQPSSSDAKILYTHVPYYNGSIPNSFLFDDFAVESEYSGTYTPSYSGLPATLSYDYFHYGSNTVYLLIPALGLYNFHTPASNSDTVDLTHMDTAVKVNFNRPSQYTTITSCNLIGYADTTDFQNCAQLYFYQSYLPANYSPVDLEYPRTNMQKYELSVSISNSSNDVASYYSYSNSVPATLPFPDETSYNLSSSQNNNFSVSFTSVKPSYYETKWTAAPLATRVYWSLFASPDSTTLHPVTFLTSLKSKLLQGHDLTGLSLSSFTFESALGLDYSGYFSYLCNPDVLKSKRLASSVIFTKTF